MKNTILRSGLILTILLVLISFCEPVLAEVVWSGDVDPANPLSWTSTTDVYIGKASYGMMEVNDGSVVVDSRSYIGEDPCTMGEVTVDGVGSSWTNVSSVYVGNYGNGSLDITNGGTVNNASTLVGYRVDSNSVVVVSGLNSLLNNTGGVSVGRYGKGRLDVNDGGEVKSSGESHIGSNTGGAGEVTINGPNSIWVGTGTLYIGHSGDGTLNITNGGEVKSGLATIAYSASSICEATVDGVDSMWTINGNLNLGLFGDGTLNVSGGGTVSNIYSFIGAYSGATGEAKIDGVGSVFTSSKYLRVGYSGDGTLNITGGAVVTNGWDGGVGYELGSIGSVTVDGAGSVWTNNQALYVGRNGSGELTITNGGLVSVDAILNIDTDGDGDGFIYIASGGMLAIEGNAASSFTNFLTLVNGTGAIKYWNGTNWAGIEDATYGVDYTLEYLTTGDLAGYTMLTVYVPGPPDPDVNGDGDVDMQDFAGFAAHWLEVGCAGPDWCGSADVDYSGDVSFSDLQIIAENWIGGSE